MNFAPDSNNYLAYKSPNVDKTLKRKKILLVITSNM